MPEARNDRSLSWLPIIGAAVVALIGVVVIVVVGSGTDTRLGLKEDDDGALVCPDTYTFRAVTGVEDVPRAWVPLRPTGIDGGEALVPDTKPIRVTVCRYPGAGTPSERDAKIRLGGTKVLTSGLSAMTKSLSKAPRSSFASGPCQAAGTTYLIGFRFATGVDWVTLPGTVCQRTTNGVWDTTVDVRDQVAQALETGAWR